MSARPDPKVYKRVREAKPEGDAKPASAANAIRVVASRGQRMYIKYAIETLNGTEGKEKSDSVVLTGMGNAVYNVVNVVEILKRRVVGLHQTTEISSETMTDKYEAVEEGKDGLEISRKVSVIQVVLSTAQLDTKHPGYQAPLPESEVTDEDLEEPRERRPRKKKAEGEKKGGDRKPREKKDGDRKPREKKEDGDRKPRERREGDRRPRREGGDRRRDDRDDRAPARGGRGGRRDDRDDRAPARGGRGGGDRRRDDRDERPRRDGGDRREGGGRREGGDRRRDDRDDRAPARGGRGGGYSEGRREGGRGGGEGRSDRGGRRN